jgi:hypothetical protein
MSDFFSRTFPEVNKMLKEDAAKRAPTNSSAAFRLMILSMGRPAVESEHSTREDAMSALAAIAKTCAPFIKNAIWVEDANGTVLARASQL